MRTHAMTNTRNKECMTNLHTRGSDNEKGKTDGRTFVQAFLDYIIVNWKR